MKLLVDFFPVVLFFIAFKAKGIFIATLVAIIASIFQIGYMFAVKKKVEPMMWLSLGIIVVFGGATLILHDETFIKWKPSILYWTMGLAMLVGQMIFKKIAIEALLGKKMSLPRQTWKTVNICWSLFFMALGGINIFIAYSFSTDIWVNFKLFGIMGCIILFALIQGLLLGSKMKPIENGQKDANGI
jgi:intracellular septation protein